MSFPPPVLWAEYLLFSPLIFDPCAGERLGFLPDTAPRGILCIYDYYSEKCKWCQGITVKKCSRLQGKPAVGFSAQKPCLFRGTVTLCGETHSGFHCKNLLLHGGEDHLRRRSSSPPCPPLLGCFLVGVKIHQMKWRFCLKRIGRRGISANFAAVSKTFRPRCGCRNNFRKLHSYLQNIKFRHGVQGAKPPCK